MAEMGRLRLISRLCKQTKEFLTTWGYNNEPDIYYLTQGGIQKNTTAEPPAKALNFTELGTWIRRELQENAAVIFIGDGNYNRIEVSRTESMLARKHARVAAVHAGAGSDIPTMKRLAGRGGKVCSPEEIWKAMAFILLSETMPEEVTSAEEAEDDGWDS